MKKRCEGSQKVAFGSWVLQENFVTARQRCDACRILAVVGRAAGLGDEKNRNSEQNYSENREGGNEAGLNDDGGSQQQNRRDDNNRWNHGITRNAKGRIVIRTSAKDEDRGHRQSVEWDDRGHEGICELLEGSGEDKDHTQGRAQPDRHARSLKSPIDPRNRLEEEAISSSCEKHSRSRHHRAVESAEGRDHYCYRDESNPDRTDQLVGHISGDELRVADLFNGQHRQICNVREQIKADDYERAVDEHARQIFCG